MNYIDERALEIVRDYIKKHNCVRSGHLIGIDNVLLDLIILWKCEVLQNVKYGIVSKRAEFGKPMSKDKYYELSYNKETKKWYLKYLKKLIAK